MADLISQVNTIDAGRQLIESADEIRSGSGPLFKSFFMGGFECSCHGYKGCERLDLIAATRHDQFAEEDYARLSDFGILTARDGIRWHRIEPSPGQYDFSSVLPMVRAARAAGVQMIWDICHYGWPEWLDVFSPQFVDSLARLGKEFVRLLRDEGVEVPYVVPVNEISFVSWIGGTEGYFPPYARGRALELKQQYVRATIACIEAVWEVAAQARICIVDPLVNVVPASKHPDDIVAAENYHRAQFEANDMLAGRLCPQLGGHPKYLDILGVNYYVHNQWKRRRNSEKSIMIGPSHPGYRPLHDLLAEIYNRYQRPLFIAETGIEDEKRPRWLRHICRHVREALRSGIPIHGICLYPIIDYPGWLDQRHCHVGLWGYADDEGRRPVYLPLARELRRQQLWFDRHYPALRQA